MKHPLRRTNNPWTLKPRYKDRFPRYHAAEDLPCASEWGLLLDCYLLNGWGSDRCTTFNTSMRNCIKGLVRIEISFSYTKEIYLFFFFLLEFLEK